MNLSLGIPTCFGMQEFYLDPLFAVVNSARILFPNTKFLVVQAAGNDGCELVSYFKPSYNPKPDNLILVGATMFGGYKLSDSNFGDLIDIAAPGAFSILYYSTGKIQPEAGTSFAAPLVAGAAALIWAKEPELTPQEVIQRLKDTANCSIPEFGGAGVLDIYKALDPISTSVPTNLGATVVSSTQIDLSCTASTDNVEVAGYKIYRDGAYLKSVTTTSTSDTGLSPGTQYCYTVSAYDVAGNESEQSSQVCATTQSAVGQYMLTVNKIGQGTVSSSTAGIDCGNDCSNLYEDGMIVNLTAIADNGWGG